MDAEEVLAMLKSLPSRGKAGNRFNAYCVKEEWLKSALAAHTAWLMERFPRYELGDGTDMGMMNSAVADCRTVLQQEINDLTK